MSLVCTSHVWVYYLRRSLYVFLWWTGVKRKAVDEAPSTPASDKKKKKKKSKENDDDDEDEPISTPAPVTPSNDVSTPSSEKKKKKKKSKDSDE